MSDIKHDPYDRPDNSGNPNHHRPYWKRAHRSVGFWIAVFLMLAAMIIYVLSEDLAVRARPEPQPPLFGSVEH